MTLYTCVHIILYIFSQYNLCFCFSFAWHPLLILSSPSTSISKVHFSTSLPDDPCSHLVHTLLCLSPCSCNYMETYIPIYVYKGFYLIIVCNTGIMLCKLFCILLFSFNICLSLLIPSPN